MQSGPITEAQRETLQSSRQLLLELHKYLLDRERDLYEAANGKLKSPNEYFNLVLNDPQFEWLRKMSGTIVEIDEALSRRSTADSQAAGALLDQVRTLLIRNENGDDYQRRYWQAIQDSPDVVITHVKLERLINQPSAS